MGDPQPLPRSAPHSVCTALYSHTVCLRTRCALPHTATLPAYAHGVRCPVLSPPSPPPYSMANRERERRAVGGGECGLDLRALRRRRRVFLRVDRRVGREFPAPDERGGAGERSNQLRYPDVDRPLLQRGPLHYRRRVRHRQGMSSQCVGGCRCALGGYLKRVPVCVRRLTERGLRWYHRTRLRRFLSASPPPTGPPSSRPRPASSALCRSPSPADSR